MFSKRSIAAIFAIAIASSLIVVSSSFVDSAYAFASKKIKQHQYGLTLPVPFSGFPVVLDEDESRSRTSHSANAGDSGWTIEDANGFPAKEVNMWKEECNDA